MTRIRVQEKVEVKRMRSTWFAVLAAILAAIPAVCGTLAATGINASAQQAKPTEKNPPAAQQPAAAANANPFPEAESRAAEKAANASEDAASAGSSSDETAGSSSRTRMEGLDLLGTSHGPARDDSGRFIQNPELAKKDVKVGKFYLDSGNYAGAYSRFKEATEVGPGNAEAVYGLAEASRKVDHLDEAESNYKLYLMADPKGKRAKDARKALKELAGK